MINKPFIQLIAVVIFSFLAYSSESPIKVKPSDYEGFSVERAMDHLNMIADKIHPIGSPANKEKRDYITDEFRRMGYEVRLFTGISENDWGGHFRLAKSENIIALKKGEQPGKQLIVMGHYDSVLESAGAADDGHAVAAMLDVADQVKDQSFTNDILFLVTDGEEMGLFGAQAYVDSFEMDSIGVLLNFEARGNSGPCYAFEWSDNNRWLVDAFRHSVSKPIANSLSYEIYNRMPNGSDFTMFKDKDVPGINHAFIDGFAFYHSPADTPENINLESVQHSGDYMYNLVQYFGNADFSVITDEGNATFFNMYTALVTYPGSFDLILLILTVLVVLLNVTRRLKTEEGSIKTLLKGLGVQLLTILVTAGLAYLVLIGLKAVYPHYFKFYSGQFYNHKWYLLFITGIAVLVYSAISGWAFKENIERMTSSMYVLYFAITAGFYAAIPTGTYLIMIPLLTFAIIDGITLFVKYKWVDQHKYTLHLLPLIIALGLWIPALHTIFLAFSLTGILIPAILIALFLPFISICIYSLWNEKKWMIWFGWGITLLSIVGGHWTSTASNERPVQSYLNYYINQYEGTAFWYTNDEINEGNAGVLIDTDTINLRVPYDTKAIATKTEVMRNTSLIETIDKIDTFSNNIKSFRLPITGTISQLAFDDDEHIASLLINGNETVSDDGLRLISLFGFQGDTLDFKLTMKEEIPLYMDITMIDVGLPRNDVLPVEYMRTGGKTITYHRKTY